MKSKKLMKIFYIVIAIFLLIAIYLDTFLILKYNVLPTKYLIVYSIIVGLIPMFLIFFTLFKKRNKKLKLVFGIIEIIYTIVLIIALYFLNNTFNFLDDFANRFDYETKNYYILVNNDNKYNSIKELKNKKIGYTAGLDENIDNALQEILKIVTLKEEKYDGYNEILEKLYNDEIESMLILQSNYDMLVENDFDISVKTKILYKFTVKEKTNKVGKEVNVLKENFNIYISGIDSYDSVTEKTRSDVNIVMSVNPKAHKILLINIPRDYYVELDGTGQKDKLTHAGVYGVEMSVKTIENLLDIDINYYVKVNYNALINLVDALDGVEVYSEYDFSSFEFHHKFKKGYNNVDGKLALDFVRTRKAFKDGDRVRGENQQRMIQALVKKACSASILLKYDKILKSLNGTFATNISTDDIMSIIKMQLDKMPTWSIETISLNGTDAYKTTYSTPNQELYVMVPDEQTIVEAKNKLAIIKDIS